MEPHAPPSSSLFENRRAQIFPVLDQAQVRIARRFGGEPRSFTPHELVFSPGQLGAPAYLVLSGSIKVARRDGALGVLTPIVTQMPGELTGEIGSLSGGPALAEGRAGEDGAEAMPFDSAQLRSLVVGTAEIGETVMRAFVLRRAFLIEVGAGVVLLGSADSADGLSLQNFLRRNAVPYEPLDPATDAHARALIERLGITDAELPLAICPDGTVLRKPNEKALAQCLGLLPSYLADRSYDVAIVGAGPAGLAAAVYGASEGLSVLVLDARSFGGQAGASARIENYLGFPTGISGAALTGRAYAQAEKFGAVMAIPAEVRQLRSLSDNRFELELSAAQPVRASAVVVASGARYRRLDLPNVATFEGRGIYYWASPIEVRLCARRDVVVVGGGNSAGQGVVYLASHVAHVDLLLRGSSLSEGMSQYLVERIRALPNVTVHTGTELTRLSGDATEGLQEVCWRERPTGREERQPIRHVFLFIGAVPSTEWLKGCEVKVDARGFVHTGLGWAGAVAGEPVGPVALWLETSLPGVFAIGDVRAGSVKRVSAAVGEGAGVVAQLHLRLQALRVQARAEPASRAPPERPGDLSEPVTAGRTVAAPLPGAARAGA